MKPKDAIPKHLRRLRIGNKVYVTGFPLMRNGDCGLAIVTRDMDRNGNIKIFPIYKDIPWQHWDLIFPAGHKAKISLWEKGV